MTENVIVATAPIARAPVQLRFGLVKLIDPEVVVTSLLNVASSSTPVRLSVNLASLIATAPALVTVTV